MKVLIVWNEWMCCNGKFDISTPRGLSIAIESSLNIKEIVVCTGPAHYTTFRKGISIGNALKISDKCELFGFSMIDHFLNMFGSRCFYKQNNLIWINDYGNKFITNVHKFNITSDFVGNEKINECILQDCSIDNIWKYFDKLKYPIEQVYYDKFNWK